jgi:hypothetical protein
VGTIRRELLDHVVVLSEEHLRRLLRQYIEYYNAERVHTSIGDSPAGRAPEIKPLGSAKAIGFGAGGRPSPSIFVARSSLMSVPKCADDLACGRG